MARTSHSRSDRVKARKEAGGASQGNGPDGRTDGQKNTRSGGHEAAAPANIDAALDSFVSKAQREFASVAPNPSNAPSGTYHPAPSSPPLRWLGIGLLLGITVGTVGVLLALALSR